MTNENAIEEIQYYQRMKEKGLIYHISDETVDYIISVLKKNEQENEEVLRME